MSLSIAMKSATSGLLAAQIGLRTTADNIANVNTPGYVRKMIDQQQLVVSGMGQGVSVSGVKRVTDQYLQVASLTAGSDASRWGVVSQYLDNAQGLFGDPSGNDFYFGRLDKIWSSFAASADDPSSSILRSQSIASVQDFLAETGRINSQVTELGKTVDSRIGADVATINSLLQQVQQLNADISRAKLSGGDASGSENIQSALVDQLSGLMNIQIQGRTNGGVTLRSTEGYELAGDSAAKLSFNRTDATQGYIAIEQGNGLGNTQPITVRGGELRGLLDLRNDILPGMSDQLGEFANRVSEQINAAHNASTRVPAPASLTGRNTGLDLTSAVAHFTGTSTLALVDATGVVKRTVAIDFSSHTMSVNGGGPSAFTDATFLADLNASMGGFGTASFAGGALSLNATTPNGLAIDEGSSNKAGRAFSQFFGLNDMIRTSGITNYETGLTTTDPHGFTPGDTISFRLAQADGQPIRDIAVTIPAATTMQDLLNALNSNTTGVGLFGAFSLDSDGQLSFSSSGTSDISASITTDNTSRGAGGPSISQLFGLGVIERKSRPGRFSVDAALIADPTKMSLNKLDLSVAAGKPAIRPGDGKGALAIAAAGDVSTAFDAAGDLGNVSMSVSRYASEFGGSIGRRAESANTNMKSAEAVAGEATARLQSVEGVNLDEELVRLTTYQQAFNASARMIQAAKELFDVLTNMI